jgi:dTDP-4-dehydrorhamnose 3,5-epimerase
MKLRETSLQGLYLIEPFVHDDLRGTFVKTYQAEEFKTYGLEYDFRESFYSVSHKNVIRGMHFQLPPHDHAKLVFATEGKILDVIIDLRKSSRTFGRYESFELSGLNRHMLYIPRGMAHGFCSLTDNATVFYSTSTVHTPSHDAGLRYDSFGFDWPVEKPVISQRDLSFPSLGDFSSPF